MDTRKWTSFNIVLNQFMITNDRRQLFEDVETIFNPTLDDIRELVFANGMEDEFK